MSADIIILPVIRRERDHDAPQEISVSLAGERLAKVQVISNQLERPIDIVAQCLLNEAVDKLDDRILLTAFR